jgi:hypothetical protein
MRHYERNRFCETKPNPARRPGDCGMMGGGQGSGVRDQGDDELSVVGEEAAFIRVHLRFQKNLIVQNKANRAGDCGLRKGVRL